MPASNIKINGVAASNDDLPINVLVNLDNQNVGGETTFLWVIVDQPAGAADALSSTVIQNPTFTPKKEGTYLLNLLVNGTLTNQKIVGVRQVKSRNRILAARETTEDSLTRGWAADANTMLTEHDDVLRKGTVITGVAGAAGLLAGDVLRITGVSTIKAGLPGQENVLTFNLAHANVAAEVTGPLLLLETGVDGSGAPANGALIFARVLGPYAPLLVGVPVVGDPVFVSDLGKLALAAGTFSRIVGRVSQVTGPNYRVYFDADGSSAGPVIPPALSFLEATATLDTTTASAVDVLQTSMQLLAVPAGTYLAMYSTSVQHNANNNNIFVNLYVNGLLVAHTERQYGDVQANENSGLSFQAIVVLGAPVTVEVRWRTTGATATAHERALTLVRIA